MVNESFFFVKNPAQTKIVFLPNVSHVLPATLFPGTNGRSEFLSLLAKVEKEPFFALLSLDTFFL